MKVTVIGEASKIEYSIDNGVTWKPDKGEEVETKIITEGTEEKETEYTYTFKELELGKSYFVRIMVYNEKGKNVEVISGVVTLSYIMTATEEDVLEGRTYLTEEGTLKEGAMKNNVAENKVLQTGESYTIPKGYHSGGEIKAKDLASQTNGTAVAGNILKGKTAYVKGKLVTGSMTDHSGKTLEASTITNEGDYSTFTIPEDGFYTTKSKLSVSNSKINSSKATIICSGRTERTWKTVSKDISISGYLPGNYKECKEENFIVSSRLSFCGRNWVGSGDEPGSWVAASWPSLFYDNSTGVLKVV